MNRFPTHRCKVCGALWIKHLTGQQPTWGEAQWSLYSRRCGPCCDNAPMGAQIEPIGDMIDGIMVELAYARHVEMPISESARRILSLIETGSFPTADAQPSEPQS